MLKVTGYPEIFCRILDFYLWLFSCNMYPPISDNSGFNFLLLSVLGNSFVISTIYVHVCLTELYRIISYHWQNTLIYSWLKLIHCRNWYNRAVIHNNNIYALRGKLTFLANLSAREVEGGGHNPCPLRKCKFLWGKNEKCLECSEMQEYAKKLSGIFVRVSLMILAATLPKQTWLSGI